MRKIYATIAVLLLVGGSPTAASAETGEAAELEQLLSLPAFMLTTSVSAAAGYRDNVLLSPENAEGSGFFQSEVEAMLLRVPAHGLDGYLFFNALETRYFSTQKTDHERTVFLVSELRWQTTDSLKLSLLAQGYHHDQVFDVSATEVALDTAQLKVTGLVVAPAVRWSFAPQWWIEAMGSGRRDAYDRDIDGYDEGELAMRAGRTWGYGSELSFGGAGRRRDHDTREQFTVAGRPLAGTRLKIQQREVSAQLAWVPDAGKRWRITAVVRHEENRDNGSGYFDFDRNQFQGGVAWKREPWELRVSASASGYIFPVQLVGVGIDPDHRRKEEWRVTVEVTRQLMESFDLLAYYESERSTSNDERSRFRINSGYLGLRWHWDGLPTMTGMK